MTDRDDIKSSNERHNGHLLVVTKRDDFFFITHWGVIGCSIKKAFM